MIVRGKIEISGASRHRREALVFDCLAREVAGEEADAALGEGRRRRELSDFFDFGFPRIGFDVLCCSSGVSLAGE